MRRTTMTAILCMGVAGAALAQDEGDRDPNVEARHQQMKLYAYNLGILGAMAKGERDYDADLAVIAATRLHALADLDQTGYWPEGTSNADLDYSRALPAIWSDMDEFDEHKEELVSAAAEMQSVAGDGAEAIGGQMRSLGGACGGCHEEFRESDD